MKTPVKIRDIQYSTGTKDESISCPGCKGPLKLIPRNQDYPAQWFCKKCRRGYPWISRAVRQRVRLDDFPGVRA